MAAESTTPVTANNVTSSETEEQGDDDDDFGDFSEMPTSSAVASTSINNQQPKEEDKNDDDDGFGDFANFSSATTTTNSTKPTSKIGQSRRYTSPSPRMSDLFSSLDNSATTTTTSASSSTLLPDKEEFSDDLWTRLNPAADHRSSPASNSSNSNSSSTFGPALSFVWEDAKANQQWMKVLKMDPKNIVSFCFFFEFSCGHYGTFFAAIFY